MRRLLPVLLLLALALPPPVDAAPPRFDALACRHTAPLEMCNARMTTSDAPLEINLAIDPADPDHMVAVAKAANASRGQGGATVTLFATTFDAGRTWIEGNVQSTRPMFGTPVDGTWSADNESDPVAAFAANGDVLLITLHITNGRPDAVVLYRSVDGGRTWAREGSIFDEFIVDKPWIETDAAGVVHLVTYASTAGFTANGVYHRRSLDHGATWSAPTLVCDGCLYPHLALLPQGPAVLAMDFPPPDFMIGIVKIARSLDGGATFGPAVAGFEAPAGNLGTRATRTTNLAKIAADTEDADTLYAVSVQHSLTDPGYVCHALPIFSCVELPDWDVVVRKSEDGGATWSAPARVNDDPIRGLAHFTPEIAAAADGGVHVAWFDQRHDPTGATAHVYFAHSRDGLVFGPNLRVTDLPTPVSPCGVTFCGGIHEYMGLESTERSARLVFPDHRYGIGAMFYAEVV